MIEIIIGAAFGAIGGLISSSFVTRIMTKKPHKHGWSSWRWHNKHDNSVYSRSCGCGSIQRHNSVTGEITIWTPDGLDSGLLDKGMSRRIYEELE